MPVNAVKTAADEAHWKRAKEQAGKQGEGKNYAYIMGIFKQMQKGVDPDDVDKAVSEPLVEGVERHGGSYQPTAKERGTAPPTRERRIGGPIKTPRGGIDPKTFGPDVGEPSGKRPSLGAAKMPTMRQHRGIAGTEPAKADEPRMSATLARKAEQLPGGLGAGRPDSDFDTGALAQGIKVEMEHGNDTPKGRATAKEVAKDHLTEDRSYYTKLAEMEKAVGSRGAGSYSMGGGAQPGSPRGAQVGEVHDWGRGQMRKTGPGQWEPVSGGRAGAQQQGEAQPGPGTAVHHQKQAMEHLRAAMQHSTAHSTAVTSEEAQLHDGNVEAAAYASQMAADSAAGGTEKQEPVAGAKEAVDQQDQQMQDRITDLHDQLAKLHGETAKHLEGAGAHPDAVAAFARAGKMHGTVHKQRKGGTLNPDASEAAHASSKKASDTYEQSKGTGKVTKKKANKSGKKAGKKAAAKKKVTKKPAGKRGKRAKRVAAKQTDKPASWDSPSARASRVTEAADRLKAGLRRSEDIELIRDVLRKGPSAAQTGFDFGGASKPKAPAKGPGGGGEGSRGGEVKGHTASGRAIYQSQIDHHTKQAADHKASMFSSSGATRDAHLKAHKAHKVAAGAFTSASKEGGVTADQARGMGAGAKRYSEAANKGAHTFKEPGQTSGRGQRPGGKAQPGPFADDPSVPHREVDHQAIADKHRAAASRHFPKSEGSQSPHGKAYQAHSEAARAHDALFMHHRSAVATPSDPQGSRDAVFGRSAKAVAASEATKKKSKLRDMGTPATGDPDAKPGQTSGRGKRVPLVEQAAKPADPAGSGRHMQFSEAYEPDLTKGIGHRPAQDKGPGLRRSN